MLDAVSPYVKVFGNARDIIEADNLANLSIRIVKACVRRQHTLPTMDKVTAPIVRMTLDVKSIETLLFVK